MVVVVGEGLNCDDDNHVCAVLLWILKFQRKDKYNTYNRYSMRIILLIVCCV